MTGIHKTLLILCALLASGAFLAACRHNPVGVENQPRIAFATEVLPVLQSNCTKSGCHEEEGGRSRLDFGTARGILANVVPYDPLNSRLYTAITSTWSGIMPPSPSPPLSRDLRTKIYLWILQGADTTSTGK